MKHIRIKAASLAAAMTLLGISASQAQSMDAVLDSVETNNGVLRSARAGIAALTHELRADNRLSGPSVEYSPFYRSGVSGTASSELIVSQEFDFPTLYGARSRAARASVSAAEARLSATRTEILLQAAQAYIEVAWADSRMRLLERRMEGCAHLTSVMERRLAAGDATQLEINRVKMDSMDLALDMAGIESARRESLATLAALNGGRSIAIAEPEYPDFGTDTYYDIAALVSADSDVRSAEAEYDATGRQIAVSRQGWLPKLSVGYRRNTERSDASNGFLVGASLDLFGTPERVKAARRRQAQARIDLEDAESLARSRAAAAAEELRALDRTLSAYDRSLMDSTLDLLRKAVDSGHMPVNDYYIEANSIYERLMRYEELRYQRAIAGVGLLRSRL